MVDQPPDRFVRHAVSISQTSPCRSKRGVVIFAEDSYRWQLLGSGYNDKPAGFGCDGSEACKRTCGRDAVHAEQAAMFFAAHRVMALARGYPRGKAPSLHMLHAKTVNGVLVPSGGPSCVECSKLMVFYGIHMMWLYHEAGWRRYEIGEFHRLSLEALNLSRSRDV